MAKGIFLFQRNYIVKILEWFEMNNCHKFQTPMVEGIHFMFEMGKKEVDQILYEQMVGSLIFFTYTPFDISYIANVVSKFLKNPQ